MLVELGSFLRLCDSNDTQYVDIWWIKEYGISESLTKDCILKNTIQHDISKEVYDG